MDQKQTQGQQKHGQDAPQSGRQNWSERQTPNPTRDQGDGSRQEPGKPGSNTERGGTDRDRTRNSETGGITKRDLDREMDEQEELPDRGTDQSDR